MFAQRTLPPGELCISRCLSVFLTRTPKMPLEPLPLLRLLDVALLNVPWSRREITGTQNCPERLPQSWPLQLERQNPPSHSFQWPSLNNWSLPEVKATSQALHSILVTQPAFCTASSLLLAPLHSLQPVHSSPHCVLNRTADSHL